MYRKNAKPVPVAPAEPRSLCLCLLLPTVFRRFVAKQVSISEHLYVGGRKAGEASGGVSVYFRCGGCSRVWLSVDPDRPIQRVSQEEARGLGI